MKQILVVAIALIVSVSSFGQKFVSQHAGPSYQSYNKVLTRVNPDGIGFDNQYYFSSPTSPYQSPVAYRTEKYDFVTEKSKLINRIFKVDTVYSMNGYENRYAIFRMEDTLTKEVIFYLYDFQYSSSFTLLTEPIKIKLDETELSKNISREFDEVDNEIRISSSVSIPVSIWKSIKNGKSYYYLDLNADGSTLTKGNGVTVLFSDGTKWSKPTQEVDVRYSSGWKYSSFITLTPADLQLFKTKTIKKFKLYIYDNEMDPYDGLSFQYYITKVMTMK